MGELMRFRSIRAPQRLIPEPRDLILLERPPIGDDDRKRGPQLPERSQFVTNLLTAKDRPQAARAFDFDAVLQSPRAARPIVSEFDRWLASHKNRPAHGAFVQEIKVAAAHAAT